MEAERIKGILTDLREATKRMGDTGLRRWIQELKIEGVAIPDAWRKRWDNYLFGIGMALANFPECNTFDARACRDTIFGELNKALTTGNFPDGELKIDGSWYVFPDGSKG